MSESNNPWRRGPAISNNGIPVAAKASVPLNPRGPATGFFTPPRYANNAGPGNVAPAQGCAPICAYAGKVKNGKGV